MRRLNLLQLDSVPVLLRTQYLPAFSRLGPYDPHLHDDLAYTRDEWIEAFVHEASLIPVEDEPLTRFLKRRARDGHTWKPLYEIATTEERYVEEVLAEVRDRGPLRASDLSDRRPRTVHGWGSRSAGAVALDWLFRVGEVGVRRTPNFEKVFDLIDRIVPAQVLAQPDPAETDAIAELLLRAARAFGVATPDCLVDYFRLPRSLAKPVLGELVRSGELEPVQVEGTAAPMLLYPGLSIPRAISTSALVSPFDPVVWNRRRTRWLFDFDYKIEIYVPKPKRRYGYYVLPFLLNERLVARCDLKTDRERKVLVVRGSFAEPGFNGDRTRLIEELANELKRLATMVAASDIEIEPNGDIATELTQMM